MGNAAISSWMNSLSSSERGTVVFLYAFFLFEATGAVGQWLERYTGLATPSPNFPANRIIHLRLLRKNPF
jgi:hypothetical protein